MMRGEGFMLGWEGGTTIFLGFPYLVVEACEGARPS
jgi:hypothetical protein